MNIFPSRTITASATRCVGTGFFLLLTGNEAGLPMAEGKTALPQRALPAKGILRHADQRPQFHHGFIETAREHSPG